MSGKQASRDLQYIPPEPVSAAARKGLALRQKFHRGGTMVGVARARDLKNRTPLSDDIMKRMAAYFARHDIDKRAQNFGNDEDPSPGYVAWLMWGGDAGKTWVEGQRQSRLQRPAVKSH
ncbi:hypothetical protein [Neorhizobium sp. JUb45]|uniref:hypothetical protein n=1 Tax=unclassified Neorhizobium TaxID=2629175 RepID=UPI001052EAA1|nr:hypothetical protein [Neorhizobium sp. JUb45]TCR06521.1 hypothetical protein EDF70_101479 [Neorhizobium sp. JUb45]